MARETCAPPVHRVRADHVACSVELMERWNSGISSFSCRAIIGTLLILATSRFASIKVITIVGLIVSSAL